MSLLERYQDAMNHHRIYIVAAPFSLLLTANAHAASLQKVNQSDWGVSGLPSYVNMYIYVPDKLAEKPPILVAAHHCQGTGSGTYDETKSNLVPLADKLGFIMIFPEATGHNCWDVGSDKSLKHDGGGDTHAIAQMVRYTLSKYKADASRVYAFGGSSGAMMTEALMGVYPDLFMGGVGISGVPCGCWAEQYSGDTATNGQWSGPCAGGSVTKTAEAWGTLVRSMFPGYSGHRPRLQLWHGDPDSTISYNNLGESIKEWTNLLGLSTNPTTTDTPKSGTTHQIWKNSCGFTVLETFSVSGAGHAVSWDVATVSSFLGLDKALDQDPEAAACPSAGGNGGTGSGGASGTATESATGGRSSETTGAGGRSSAGGSGSLAASSNPSSSGGNTARSRANDGGTHATASSATAGDRGGSSSTEATRTTAQIGGSTGTRRTSEEGGDADTEGTTTRTNGSSTGPNGAITDSKASPSDGCNCVVGRTGTPERNHGLALLFGMIGLVACRRRRT